MTNEPLVSVITPCRNAEAFIGQTIESVLAQSHAPVEHVIVDDGSEDGSWTVIDRFAGLHPDRLRAEQVPMSGGGCTGILLPYGFVTVREERAGRGAGPGDDPPAGRSHDRCLYRTCGPIQLGGTMIFRYDDL
jgi:glycosyltransferase involved in cell wall biosynthesis